MLNLRYKWVKLNDDQQFNLKVMTLFKPAFIMVEAHRICVVRTEEGWFGINNICPHAGAALHNGHCNKNGIVTCPVHGYKFDVKTGHSMDGNNYNQKTFQFDKREDGFYLGIKKF